MNETKILASFIAALKYDDLPAPVISKAKDLILDQTGCQIAGSSMPLSKLIFEFTSEYRGKQRESTIVNNKMKVSAQDAAFTNANFGHAFMGDDTDSICHGHFGSILIPATLAMAERENASGKDLLLAVVTGYEVASRIGAAARKATLRGFHPGPIFGPFGAAAATGKLIGLNEQELLNAITVAGSQCCGLMEYSITGGSVNRLHAGIASYNGTLAAIMAQMGFSGPPTLLEGARGFFHAYAGESFPEEILSELGSRYRVMLITLKPYCCCGTATAALEAISNILQQNNIDPSRIIEITAFAPQSVYRMVGSVTEPTDITSFQLSGNYSLALRLVKGGNSFREYTEENLRDPDIISLASRSRYILDEGLAQKPGCYNPSKVTIKMENGAAFEDTVLVAKGSVIRPMDHDEMKEKFLDFTNGLISGKKASAIIDIINDLENVKEIRQLTSLL